ncbi:energy transducer TonB [Bermanella marisrubri]|nr:energy transducer TonB [Bermanella marisrubri]QIZ83490.1 energy transducer TonB [Bermanella marisrubri]
MGELVELLDSSIKITLGAIIAGLTAYWMSGSRVKQHLNQQKIQHQRDLIEGIAQQSEQVHHVFMKYFELIIEYMNATRNGYDWPQSRRSELYLVLDEMVHSFNELTAAESKLLLLNEKMLYKTLRKFRNKVVFFRRHFYIDKKDLSEQEAQDIKREISKLREQFFAELSACYAKV